MDTAVLVEPRIDDGWRLLTELVRSGFEVDVAFWVSTDEDGWRYLYIASPSVDLEKIGDAYGRFYVGLSKIPNSAVRFSDVDLIPSGSPLAKAALAIRDQEPGRPIRYRGDRIGDLPIVEAYIYPKVSGQMTRAEILQTLVSLSNRPAGSPVKPASITLRDGTTIRGVVTGFTMQMPGGLTLDVEDLESHSSRQFSDDEIVTIQ